MSVSEFNEGIKLKSSIVWESIEADITRLLKDKISHNFTDYKYLHLSESDLNYAIGSLVRDYPNIDTESVEAVSMLPDHLSLANKVKAILSNKNYLDRDEEKAIREAEGYGVIFDVRNRRSHIKPVDLDLYLELVNATQNLVSSNPYFWEETLIKLKFLESAPSVKDLVQVSGLDTEEFHAEENFLDDNLPPKHYNDTGFLFREKILSDITRDIARGTPLITIYGEGGLGKTTLVREAVDKIAKNHFENIHIVWWHSSKLEELDSDGVKQIRDKVNPLNSIVKDLKEEMGIDIATAREENINLLLILDNLETDLTINRQETLDFVREHIHHCQIVITTRVRLGEMELPYQVLPFSNKESISYLRKLGLSANFRPIVETNDKTLGAWSEKLNNSPLYLRWFFQNLQKGKEANAILDESENLVSYIFKTVYENLSKDAQKLLGTLRIANKPLNRFQTRFVLSEWDDNRFNEARINLESSSLIRTRIIGGSNSYTISEQAKNYLSVEKLLDLDQEDIVKKLKELELSTARLKRNKRIEDIFHLDYFPEREDDSKDIIVEKLYQINRKTLRLLKEKKIGKDYHELEQEIIEEFEDLTKSGAEYAPVYRLYGHTLFNKQDYLGAVEKYQIGLTLHRNDEEKFQIEYLLAGALQRLGDDRGFNIARDLWKEYKHPRTAYLLSAHLADIGLSLEAIDVAKEAVELAEKSDNLNERDLRRAVGRYLRAVVFAVGETSEGAQSRLDLAEDCFEYLKSRLNFSYVDTRSVYQISDLVRMYIEVIGKINQTDGKTLPNGLITLFSDKKFLFEESFIKNININLEENITSGLEEFLKRLQIPQRVVDIFEPVLIHEDSKNLNGISKVLNINEKGFGFILWPAFKNIYFDRDGLLNSTLKFEDLDKGMEVKFTAEKRKSRMHGDNWVITNLAEN